MGTTSKTGVVVDDGDPLTLVVKPGKVTEIAGVSQERFFLAAT